MKKHLLGLLLAACLLSGCATTGPKDPVKFYYLLEKYQFGNSSQVFAEDIREAAGHQEDLGYMLQLYLLGPTEEGLRSPLPRGVQILEIREAGSGILLVLSDTSDSLSDIDFTRACACLTMTCLDLTDATRVTIRSGPRSATMSADNLILQDETLMQSQEENQ